MSVICSGICCTTLSFEETTKIMNTVSNFPGKTMAEAQIGKSEVSVLLPSPFHTSDGREQGGCRTRVAMLVAVELGGSAGCAMGWDLGLGLCPTRSPQDSRRKTGSLCESGRKEASRSPRPKHHERSKAAKTNTTSLNKIGLFLFLFFGSLQWRWESSNLLPALH